MKIKFCFLIQSLNKVVVVSIFLLYCNILKAQDTVADIDANVYSTITIGAQVWMKENLKTTHYRNGDVIPNITGVSAWVGLTTGAYCNYNNDNTIVATYGRLYNWYTIADDRNICPVGWHVPSKTEWDTMIDHLGGTSVAGGKMKETGTFHWENPNTGATNSSGFSALPGGQRASDGSFGDLKHYGIFSIATEKNNTEVWSPSLYYESSQAYNYYDSKKSGFSVRCLKDSHINDIINFETNKVIEIFPNPTSGIITVSLSTNSLEDAILSVFTLQGIPVFSKTFNNKADAAVDLTDYPAGINKVKVIAGETEYAEMIFKNN